MRTSLLPSLIHRLHPLVSQQSPHLRFHVTNFSNSHYFRMLPVCLLTTFLLPGPPFRFSPHRGLFAEVTLSNMISNCLLVSKNKQKHQQKRKTKTPHCLVRERRTSDYRRRSASRHTLNLAFSKKPAARRTERTFSCSCARFFCASFRRDCASATSSRSFLNSDSK